MEDARHFDPVAWINTPRWQASRLMNDGFQLKFHSTLLWYLTNQVFFQQLICFKGINSYRFLTVELQHIIAFKILVNAIIVIYRISIFSRRIQ